MARAHTSTARPTVRAGTSPTTGAPVGWIVAGVIALIVAAVAAYFAMVGGTQYNAPPQQTAAPATGVPATGAPAPQVTAAPPAAPRYP
jgi:cytochrome c-type biogenesis protein CcmH/NrfG